MDSIDLAILQEMTSGDSMLFGGINPRISPESMAKEVGLNPSTIRARMKAWRDCGFLHSWHLLPHPGTLGLHHFAGYLQAEPEARESIREAIRLTEGAVACFEHVGGLIGIGLNAHSATEAERRFALLANQPGTKTVGPIGPVSHRETGPIKTRDWQLLKALRSNPDAPIHELASAIGVSNTTAGNRLRRLIASQAVWTVPHLDFTHYDGALVRVYLDVDGIAPREAIDALDYPSVFYRDISNDRRQRAHAMIHIRSAAQMDDVEAAARAIQGVTKVTMTIPRTFQPLEAWADEQVARFG